MPTTHNDFRTSPARSLRAARIARARRRRAARRREGSVLMFVMLFLLIGTTTAAFAVQNSTFEVRAAGAMRQRSNTRNMSESVMMGAVVFLEQLGFAGLVRYPASARWGNEPETSLRPKYGLPWGVETGNLYELRNTKESNDFAGPNFPAPIVPSTGDLEGASSPYELNTELLLEAWPLSASPGEGIGGTASGRQRYRVCVTGFSGLSMPNDAVAQPGELRGLHEAIGMSRAYVDMR